MTRKINYIIKDKNTGKIYGPVHFYATANLIADRIDDKYGETIAEIDVKLKGHYRKVFRKVY